MAQQLTLDKFGAYTLAATVAGAIAVPLPATATTIVAVTARRLVAVGSPPLLIPSATPFIVQARDVTGAIDTTFINPVQLNLTDLSRSVGAIPDSRTMNSVNGVAAFVVNDGRTKLVIAEAVDPQNQLFSSKFTFGSLGATTLKGRRRPR